jgi:hypothetical protein
MDYLRPLRRGFIASALALVTGICCSTARGQYTTVINNGPNSNRVNAVFLGDGYTAGQIDTIYPSHIAAMTDHMFSPPPGDLSRDPFPRYRNYFNVHRVNVISNESGADVAPLNIFRDTALDARYYFNGATERLLYVDEGKAQAAMNSALAGADFTPAMRLITVNDTRYGGAGGQFAVYAGGNPNAPEVALHELGHSFSGLADEYGGFQLPYGGAEPQQINVTKDPTGLKWSQWLGYDQPGIGVIGAYEGGRNYDFGLYRPSQNSKMRSLGEPFDAIAREKIILDIYSIVDPLDDFLDNTLPVLDPPELWVDPIDDNVIDVDWFVNGSLVAHDAGHTFDLVDHGFGPGLYTVEARAFDPTGFDPLNGWVRRNQDLLEERVSWTVTQTVPEPSTIAFTTIALVLAVGCRLHAIRRRAI